VLADGHLLAPDGLDTLRGIAFIIPDELRAAMPSRDYCTQAAVCEAMNFLCNDWLCDVNCDYAGKCILIAAALTLIERSLLPDRPTFFVSAGRRGGGKTTTLKMLIMAVTGILPAAAAWSPNEEERRKALLSYFMAGVPYILWDNIPRGTQISCPAIEKSCTTAMYTDRKLGVSEVVATAATSIHLFTGNNINARGELASRSLNVYLKVDNPNPENREFRHPDPVDWTDDHRVEILRALYTILLGNPQLDTARDAPSKTRFKMWWRLVGSAIEHAARQTSNEIDFQKLFIDQEGEDEDSTSLADTLDIMRQIWNATFRAADVAAFINDPHNDSALREFFYPTEPPTHVASAKSIGKLLSSNSNNPVRHSNGSRVLTLVKERDTHDRNLVYRIKTDEA
jgi:hypothetical protein